MPPGQWGGLPLRFSRNGELMALTDGVTRPTSVDRLVGSPFGCMEQTLRAKVGGWG